MLFFFFITRIVLLLVSWREAAPGLSDLAEVFSSGLLFDCGFIFYALSPLILYLWLLPQPVWRARRHGYWLHLLVFTGIYVSGFIGVAEYLFWDEFHTRFNFIAIDYLIYRREVTDNILQSYPVIPIISLLFFFSLAVYLPLRPWIARAQKSTESFALRSRWATICLILPVVSFFTLSQQLQQDVQNPYLRELAANGPYQFVAAFRNNELDYLQFYSHLTDGNADQLLREELAEPDAQFISNEPYDIRRDILPSGPEKKLNIILVTVESLSSDFLSYFGNHDGLTPNLDRLVQQSLFFSNFYATGTRTTRGLEAMTLSIPPTPGRSIIKRLGREKDQWSLGQVLNEKGYRSYFAYGGRGYFENMNSFFSANGYDIVDQSSTPDHEIEFTNAWGMSDADLYRQVLKTADRHSSEQPFFIHVMTTSNHRPYTYPDGHIDIPSGSGRKGAVKYTDYALGTFLDQAGSHPWFKDTLFVIVADHQAGSAGKTTLPIARYHIPLWIYAPTQIQPKIITSLASQIDLAPTLLGLLNMSYRSCFFGKDILHHPPERALIANYQNLGLFDGQQMAILEPQRKIELQAGLDSQRVTQFHATTESSLVRRDIAYYQGAAYVYRKRINSWANRDQLTTFTAAIEPSLLRVQQ